MKKQKIRVNITTSDLSPAVKEEMWELYKKYYHYSRDYFLARIERNTHYSFYRSEGRIVGFTGLRIDRVLVEGRRRLLIYFGQTVIDANCRGQSLIPMTGAQLCFRYWRDLLLGRAYFWADALTYKAYLVFAKTLEEYYPCRHSRTPQDVQKLVRHIGALHYGETFDPHTGTVQKDTIWVSDPTVRITPRYRLDPDIRFFEQANPRHVEGHGLLTLAPVNARNVRLIMRRFFGKLFQWPAAKPAGAHSHPKPHQAMVRLRRKAENAQKIS